MNHSFKVGDCIKVYGFKVPECVAFGLIESIDDKVTDTLRFIISHNFQNGILETILKNSTQVANIKQCRKLKPKAKPREFWINIYEDEVFLHPTEAAANFNATDCGQKELIHVRELRVKK